MRHLALPPKSPQRAAPSARFRYQRVLGIMSGTSLDGVDFVLTAIAEPHVRLVRHWFVRFPPRLRAALRACAADQASSWELARAHHDLGRFYANGAKLGLENETVEAVGVHGQTVFHAPDGTAPATLQLGETAYLADELRVPVVGNFRVADLAAGGQGAPLATLFHVKVFGEGGRHVCVQNLGGIGNVTSIDARAGGPATVIAFDTGPGNLLIDGAVELLTRGRRHFDREGRWAARGTPATDLVERWLRARYFRRPPPKSTGREAFGAAYLRACWRQMSARRLTAEGRLATLTHFTAESVADAYARHLPAEPERVVLCGGGVRNEYLVERLGAALGRRFPALEVVSSDALGWPVETIEGAAFALLARERLLRRTGNLPQTTGASRAVWCGQVAEAS